MPAFHYIIGGQSMRANRRSRDEQYQLVLACRQSGLSDYNWCREHDINPGTFYNWVKRLRQHGGYDIPDPAGRDTYAPLPKQDIVKIELVDGSASNIPEAQDSPCHHAGLSFHHSLELHTGNTKILIANDIDPDVLAMALQMLKSPASC